MPKTEKGGFWDFLTSIQLQNFKKIEWEHLRLWKLFENKNWEFLTVSKCRKIWKEGPFRILKHLFCCKILKKWMEDPLGKTSEKKSHKAEKRGESHSAEKVRTFCFELFVKKMAHTHGFEPEPSGLRGKHLTTRPRTPELCDLRAETRELSRGKKHRTFP